jgi:hypothetical protein
MFALVRTVVEFSLRADDRQVVRETSAFGRNTVSIGGTPRSTVARLAPCTNRLELQPANLSECLECICLSRTRELTQLLHRQVVREVLFGDAPNKAFGLGKHLLRRAKADAIDHRVYRYERLGFPQRMRGNAFIEWVSSPEGQKAIAGYKIEGEQLFFPNHGSK